jgi:hypothetical protein
MKRIAAITALLSLFAIPSVWAFPVVSPFYQDGAAAARTKPGVTHVRIGGVDVWSGSGSPENVVTAPVGSAYFRSDGGTGTTLYTKDAGTGNTGWVAMASGSVTGATINDSGGSGDTTETYSIDKLLSTFQPILSEGAFADGDKTALDTLVGSGAQAVGTGDSPTFDAIHLGVAGTTQGVTTIYGDSTVYPFTIFTHGSSGPGVGWAYPTTAPGGDNYLLAVNTDGSMHYTDPSTFGGSFDLDSAISGATAKSTPDGTEEIPVNDGGTLKKLTPQDIIDNVHTASIGTGGGATDDLNQFGKDGSGNIHFRIDANGNPIFYPATAPALFQKSESASNVVADFFNPSLGVGNWTYTRIGVDGSDYNHVRIGFTNAGGGGSTSNYGSLGIAGGANIIFGGDGNIGIGSDPNVGFANDSGELRLRDTYHTPGLTLTDLNRHVSNADVNPSVLYSDEGGRVTLMGYTAAALTISEIHIRLDEDPTTELAVAVYQHADQVGYSSGTLVGGGTTTAGSLDVTSGFTDNTVPAHSKVWLLLSTSPDASTKHMEITVFWSYD